MPAGDREGERKRDPDGDGERERGREICHPRTPAGDRGREKGPEYVVFWPDLSLYLAREILSVGFGRIRQKTQMTSPDSAGNPDGLARSGRKCRNRKPTHTGVGLTDPALHLRHSLPLSRSRRSVKISSS
jgi:hypothetical protein